MNSGAVFWFGAAMVVGGIRAQLWRRWGRTAFVGAAIWAAVFVGFALMTAAFVIGEKI